MKKKKKYLIFDGDKDIIVTEESPFLVLGLKSFQHDISTKMMEMDIVAPATASGKGFFSFLPKGKIISELIKECVIDYLENNLGALAIKTPFLYKMQEEGVSLKLFEDRVYSIKSPEESSFILKPNADLGLFHASAGSYIKKESLPLRLYEMSPCFRYVLSGELSGIKKARGFFLFDSHSFCANRESAIEEYFAILKEQEKLQNVIGGKIITWFKVPEHLLENYQQIILDHKSESETIVIEILPEKKLYWDIKSFTMDENGDRLFHVQLDYENPLNYGINYHDEGELKPVIIIHNSLGTIERWLLLFFKNALKKDVPVLPLWLSPTQVRILPVKDSNNLEAIKLAEKIRALKIRVDVDDRSDTLGNKIRNAEKEWVPYTIIFGDKEVANPESLPIRQRGVGQIVLSLDNFIAKIKDETKDMPFRSLPNWLLSKEIVFTKKRK